MHKLFSTACTAACTAILLFACTGHAQAQYYATVNASSAATLRQTLHAVIDDHVRFPYTASSTDTWDILERAQQNPANSSRIIDTYKNASYRKGTDRVTKYNREHVWPKSLGFAKDGGTNYPYTDCHHLFLCDSQYNSDRGNMPFDKTSSSGSERTTYLTNGSGGGSGVYPGNSNWFTGQWTSGSWEVWKGRRGDIARAMFYMDVRYEGGKHGSSGANEPDLILTDNRQLIINSQSSSNRSIAYMGMLSTLLQWHREDPVDAGEKLRNDTVFGYQKNRNPFVDHPEWVSTLFGGSVPGFFARYGQGCSTTNGLIPMMQVQGTPLIGQNLTVVAFTAPPSQPAVLNIDIAQHSLDLTPIGFPGCTALALPVLSVSVTTNILGIANTTLPIPAQANLVGKSVQCQWVVINGGAGVALSDGGTMTFGRL